MVAIPLWDITDYGIDPIKFSGVWAGVLASDSAQPGADYVLSNDRSVY